jgi:hypothetical protein
MEGNCVGMIESACTTRNLVMLIRGTWRRAISLIGTESLYTHKGVSRMHDGVAVARLRRSKYPGPSGGGEQHSPESRIQTTMQYN